MTIREIRKYGDPVLKKPAEPVDPNEPGLAELVADMLETMYYARGVGLAAPQIGISKRLFVADITSGKDPNAVIVVLNPEIIETSGEERMEEGCLSVPGLYAPVTRPYKVRLRGQTLEGEWKEWVAEGFLARAFCHEVDHLNGMLYLDRLPPISRERILKKITKLKRAGEWS